MEIKKPKVDLKNIDLGGLFEILLAQALFSDSNPGIWLDDNEAPVIETSFFISKTREFVVRWKDKTQTKVHVSEEDAVNPHIGVALCLAEKIYGGKKQFRDVVKEVYHAPRQSNIVSEKYDEPDKEPEKK